LLPQPFRRRCSQQKQRTTGKTDSARFQDVAPRQSQSRWRRGISPTVLGRLDRHGQIAISFLQYKKRLVLVQVQMFTLSSLTFPVVEIPVDPLRCYEQVYHLPQGKLKVHLVEFDKLSQVFVTFCRCTRSTVSEIYGRR
jgi:hypothetical protein